MAGLGQQDKPARKSDWSLAVKLDGSTEDEAYAGIETGLGRSMLLLTARYFQADAISFPGLASTIRLNTRLTGPRSALLANLSSLASPGFKHNDKSAYKGDRWPLVMFATLPTALAGQLRSNGSLCWGVSMGRRCAPPGLPYLESCKTRLKQT